MYPTSTATSLPPLALHLGNLPGFDFSSDRETPISNPPSSVFSAPSSATSALSSTSISPLSLLSATTPVNKSTPCQRTGTNHVFQRASTLPLVNLPPVHRPPPPTHCHLPEGFQKCSFVDSLVGSAIVVVALLNFRYGCVGHRDHLAKSDDSDLEFENTSIESIHSRDHSSISYFFLYPPTRSILPSSNKVCGS